MKRGYMALRQNPLTAVFVVAGIFVAIGYTYQRGEETRNVTNEIVQRSPCTANPASAECQKTKNRSDRARSVGETCIIFIKVGYPCPVGERRRGVVARQGVNPSQQPGPPSGGSPGSTIPPVSPPVEQPDNGNKPPPSNPPPAPSNPPVAEPAPPVTRPTVNLPDVEVSVGDQGACVGVGGLTVGNC